MLRTPHRPNDPSHNFAEAFHTIRSLDPQVLVGQFFLIAARGAAKVAPLGLRAPTYGGGPHSVWEPTIGNGRPHRTIIYLFWAAGGLLSIECLRFPRARGPARVAENSPQTHNRGAWVPCLCPWRRLGVAPAAQGRRLNLFIYLINFMSVETTFNGPRTIRFEILISTLPVL